MYIEIYQDKNGYRPFSHWLNSVRDITTRARIDNRLQRLRAGNFGDFRSLGKGLFELRLHFGAGYRVYYGRLGNTLIVLFTGGVKKSQTKDIHTAREYFRDYKQHTHEQT